MHPSIQWLNEKKKELAPISAEEMTETTLSSEKIDTLLAALTENNYVPHYIPDSKSLLTLLETLIPKDSQVAVGGSMTLFETGVIDLLRTLPVTFYDRYAEGLTPEGLREIYLKSFDTDIYFTSTNALTLDGCLFNVDGNGNRVAAMLYGPKKVFVILGINKVVADLDAAILRNKTIAAPANAHRLNRKTPCALTGICSDCKSPDRVCSDYVLMKHQAKSDRIHVFLVGEALGF